MGPWGAVLLLLLAGGCATGLAARGDRALKAGDAEGALTLYQKALEQDPGDPALLGKLAVARARVADARTRAGEARLAKGDATGAYARFHAALEVQPGHARATAGEARALAGIRSGLEASLAAHAFQKALDGIAAAVRAGVPKVALEGIRARARAGLARAACATARAYEARGLSGNALLAYRRAADFAGGGCHAAAAATRLKAQLTASLVVAVDVEVTGQGLDTFVTPALDWVAQSGAPLRIQGPETGQTPAEARATVKVTGHLSVAQGRTETRTTLTLVRKVGEKTEANPVYKTLRRQAGQLLQQYRQLRDRVDSQARYVQYLHEAYLQTPTTALYQTLQDALQVLDDLQQQADDMGRQYNRVRAKLGNTAELLKKTVTEEAKVPATDVRAHARAQGEVVLSAPFLPVPMRAPLTFLVSAQGYAWDPVKAKGIPAQVADVPAAGILVKRARLGAGRILLRALQEALETRADALVEAGSAARKAGHEAQAVEAYVRALLLYPTAPRPAIRGFLAGARGATLDAVKVPGEAPAPPSPPKGEDTASKTAPPTSG